MEQFLWVEEYRPRDIESCVLPKTLKSSLQSFVDKETLPNLILSGGPGVGLGLEQVAVGGCLGVMAAADDVVTTTLRVELTLLLRRGGNGQEPGLGWSGEGEDSVGSRRAVEDLGALRVPDLAHCVG